MLQKTWKQAFSLKGTEKIEPSKQQIRPLFEGQQGWWQKSRRVAFLLTNISSARTWIYCNIFHRHPVENLIPIKSLMAVFTWCRHLAMIPRQLAAITHFYQMACWELEKPWLNQPFCFQSSMAFYIKMATVEIIIFWMYFYLNKNRYEMEFSATICSILIFHQVPFLQIQKR